MWLDIDGDILECGEKNAASMRFLPIPKIVQKQLEKVPKVSEFVLSTCPVAGRKPGPFTNHSLVKWCDGKLPVTPGKLRHCFATWACRFLTAAELEGFLGHQSGMVSQITARHYLGRYRAEELRKAAKAIDRQGRKNLCK